MSEFKFLTGYPPALLEQVSALIRTGRLEAYLDQRYPDRHTVQTDKALYHYLNEIKQAHMRHAPPLDSACYDSKLDVIHNALGLHTSRSHMHGGKLKARKEIRVASVFKEAPAEFLRMIAVHELAHYKELAHNKAFYQLCEHMLPGYAQIEFDLRLFLTWREISRKPS